MTDNRLLPILVLLMGVLITLIACDDGSSTEQIDPDGGSGNKTEQNSDSTVGDGGAGGSGSGSLGDSEIPCEVVSTTATDWSEKTSVGTPETVFSSLAGSCTAPFHWDGSGWTDMLTVKPATGQGTLTTTIEIDRSSARYVERQASSNATSLERYHCGALLEVDARVTLELPQGMVVEKKKVTISKSPEEDVQRIDLSIEPKDIEDWISIKVTQDNTSLSIYVFMMPIEEGCVGEINLMAETDYGSSSAGVGIAGSGFASWSDTGCGLERSPVDLDELFREIDLIDAVIEAFDQVELQGTWEDGGETVLMLEVSVTETKVCSETMGEGIIVSIPVNVVVNTADNRIRSLSGQGTVRATVMDTDLTQLDLWSSIDLQCQSETDTLAYQTIDCTDVEGMTPQLSYNIYMGSNGSDGGSLELYIYRRNSNASPGAADRVDRLQLSP